MGRFASTVAYYESARPPYGAGFFAEVARELGLDRSQRLLDIGAGPGILAIGFAPYCGEVVGVDPEPAMVEAARSAAAARGRRGDIHRGAFRGRGPKPRRLRRRHDRPRDPLARPGARPCGPRSRRQAARQDSRLPRGKRRGRPQSLARRVQGRSRSLEGRSAGRMTPTLSSPADGSSRAGRSASKRPIPFPSNGSPTASCRCPPRRRRGSAIEVARDEDRHARGARALRRPTASSRTSSKRGRRGSRAQDGNRSAAGKPQSRHDLLPFRDWPDWASTLTSARQTCPISASLIYVKFLFSIRPTNTSSRARRPSPMERACRSE